MKKNFIFTTLIFIVSGATIAFAYRGAIQEAWYEWQKPDLPEGQTYESFESAPEEQAETPSPEEPVQNIPQESAPEQTPQENNPPSATLPAQINLAVPFTTQAPFGNWGLPYQEAC